MAIKVIFTGIDEKFINQQKQRLSIIANVQLEKLALETETAIRNNITGGIRRPNSTGNLARGFFAERISNTHWAIGNIQSLNQNQKYWRHVNYGSVEIGANWEHFVPGGIFSPGDPVPDFAASRTGRWEVGGSDYVGKQHTFKPSTPIIGINYIEQTLADVPLIIQRVLSTTR